MAAGRPPAGHLPSPAASASTSRVRQPLRHAGDRRPPRGARRGPPPVRGGAPPGQAGHGAVGSTSEETLAQSPLEYLYQQFTAYVEDRRLTPRDDVLTGLATATFPDGSTPEVIDVVRVAANLFAAGQETTVRLLGSALQLIAGTPSSSSSPGRAHRIPNFIEETLRMESPIKGDFRLSRVPTTVGGVDLPAGTTVMLVNAAANRDPRRFDDPATFDPERENARHHLAFGRGIHTCPGAPLARTEARVSLERILDRTTDIHLRRSTTARPVPVDSTTSPPSSSGG